MDNKDFLKIYSNQITKKYFNPIDLKYSNDSGTFLSPYDYQKYLDFIDEIINTKDFKGYVFPLKSFNSNHIYYSLSNDFAALLDDYINILGESFNLWIIIIILYLSLFAANGAFKSFSIY